MSPVNNAHTFVINDILSDAPLQIIVTPVEGIEKDHLIDILGTSCPSLGLPFVAKVPWGPALTRQQYKESIQYWPVNFHEDKR